MRLKKFLWPFFLVMSLAGCVIMPTGPSVTMAPASGKPFNIFNSEFKKCTELAESRMGNYSDYMSSEEAQIYYDKDYVKCMTSYGNRVLPPLRMDSN